MVEKSKKFKISNLIKNCSGLFGNTQETFPRSRILSSASFWRGNQVDGLPRLFTLTQERAALFGLVLWEQGGGWKKETAGKKTQRGKPTRVTTTMIPSTGIPNFFARHRNDKATFENG